MSQSMNQDGARIVMAPGPAIMQFLPNGVYVARTSWAKDNPALAQAVPAGDQRVADLRTGTPG